MSEKEKKITQLEERWQEGYDEGWDNGFKACLIYLRETLVDELIKRKRARENMGKRIER